MPAKKFRKITAHIPNLILISVSIFLFLTLLFKFLIINKSFLSPIFERFSLFLKGKKERQVIGFVPYWNINQNLEIDFDVIDQLIYFNLMVDINGDTVTHGDEGGGWFMYHNPALDSWLKKAKEKNKKTLLCIASFDAEVMFQIAEDEKKQDRVIKTIINGIKEKGFDGVDIDFEYFEQYHHQEFGDNFNKFLSRLRKELDKIDEELILSVDIYPKAIIENHPYELKEMNEIIDQLIIMAYDFTQSGSYNAGPVAPINTDPSLNEEIRDNYSIMQTLESAKGKIDKEKLVLGIPLYGYKWRTYDEKHRSGTFPGIGTMVKYDDMKQLIEEKDLVINWDPLAQSPWVVYQEGWGFSQIYFENIESLKLKFNLVKKYQLKGIAFWALGYENREEEIWDYLTKSF